MSGVSSFFYKTPVLLDKGLTLMTSFNLNYLFIAWLAQSVEDDILNLGVIGVFYWGFPGCSVNK